MDLSKLSDAELKQCVEVLERGETETQGLAGALAHLPVVDYFREFETAAGGKFSVTYLLGWINVELSTRLDRCYVEQRRRERAAQPKAEQ